MLMRRGRRRSAASGATRRGRHGAGAGSLSSGKVCRAFPFAMAGVPASQTPDRALAFSDEMVLRQAPEAEAESPSLEGDGQPGLLPGRRSRPLLLLHPGAAPPTNLLPHLRHNLWSSSLRPRHLRREPRREPIRWRRQLGQGRRHSSRGSGSSGRSSGRGDARSRGFTTHPVRRSTRRSNDRRRRQQELRGRSSRARRGTRRSSRDVPRPLHHRSDRLRRARVGIWIGAALPRGAGGRRRRWGRARGGRGGGRGGHGARLLGGGVKGRGQRGGRQRRARGRQQSRGSLATS